MPEAVQNTLPGQELNLHIDRGSFKKDQNFIVVMESELEETECGLGDAITFHTGEGDSALWEGTGTVTHVMSCYLLDIPKFIMEKHQDPLFKNPMALFHHLQGRVGRMLTPVDKAVCIGFRIVQTAKDD
jgi:hypothetical protein